MRKIKAGVAGANYQNNNSNRQIKLEFIMISSVFTGIIILYMQFAKQHNNELIKHGTLSVASLALLTALVLPKTGLANEVNIPTTDNTPPPASAVIDNTELSQLNIPAYQDYLDSKPADFRQVETENSEGVGTENESESYISVESVGTAIITTTGLAVTALRKQIAKTINSMFSSSIVNKVKGLIFAAKAKTDPELSEIGTISLVMTRLEDISGGYKLLKSQIPFKSENLSEIFTNPKGLKIFEAALGKCKEGACLPVLQLEAGKTPGSLKGLDIVNNAIWENIAVTFNPDSKSYIKPDEKSVKSRYKIFIRSIQSEETDETKSLEITLLSEEDYNKLCNLMNKKLLSEQDSQLTSSLRQVIEAESRRKVSHPDKPIFPLIEIAV